jgi:hypothetical protein
MEQTEHAGEHSFPIPELESKKLDELKEALAPAASGSLLPIAAAVLGGILLIYWLTD